MRSNTGWPGLDHLAHFEPSAQGAIIRYVGQPTSSSESGASAGALGHFGLAPWYPGVDPEPYWNELNPLGGLSTEVHGGMPRPPTSAGPDQLGRAMGEGHKAKAGRAGHQARQWYAASFDPVPRSVKEARQFVGSLLDDPYLRETSELLVSELTTNALQHASGRFEVRVRAQPRVRVEVHDHSVELPSAKDLAPSDESGRGLQIVTRLATSWGTRKLPDGKVVWFEL
jgi:hypothetical protein